MDDILLQLFTTYKTSSYYNNSSLEVNIEWLKEKLTNEEMDTLEEQIYDLLLDNEKDFFICCLKFLWRMQQELSS
ncbi:hypothetical protein [Anaerosporobacter sp.]|uniref:hypothetical protein n=1 Tax=Anaerosporobacter sp. TaxID=1872529 RepID=UPI00286ED4DD|nr:hypothetical protein [Anaerosporobacter sp.]